MYIVKAYTPCQPHSWMWDFKRWTFATLTELPFCPSRLKVPLLMVDGWTLGFTNFLCCSLWSSFSVSPLSLHSTNGSLFSAGWRLVLRLSSGCSEGAAVAVVITLIGKLGVCRAQTAAGVRTPFHSDPPLLTASMRVSFESSICLLPCLCLQGSD